jgi:hypothetical protein
MAYQILRHDQTPERRVTEFDPSGGRLHGVTCYTDSFVVRGTLSSRVRRLTDVLNLPEEPFLVLEQVTIEEFLTGALLESSEFAQVNLSTVLFAYESEADAQPTPPELRTVKVAQRSLVTVPPFRVVGELHLLPERFLHDALHELLGRFLPVTDAMFWSDSLGIGRTAVRMLAVNHARCQILTPFREPQPPVSG